MAKITTVQHNSKSSSQNTTTEQKPESTAVTTDTATETLNEEAATSNTESVISEAVEVKEEVVTKNETVPVPEPVTKKIPDTVKAELPTPSASKDEVYLRSMFDTYTKVMSGHSVSNEAILNGAKLLRRITNLIIITGDTKLLDIYLSYVKSNINDLMSDRKALRGTHDIPASTRDGHHSDRTKVTCMYEMMRQLVQEGTLRTNSETIIGMYNQAGHGETLAAWFTAQSKKRH